MKNDSSEPKRKIKARWVILALVALCALVAGVVAAWPWLEKLADPATQRQFAAWVETLGVWGRLVVLGIQVVQIFIAFIPGKPVELLAGVLYAGFGGLVICLVHCCQPKD